MGSMLDVGIHRKWRVLLYRIPVFFLAIILLFAFLPPLFFKLRWFNLYELSYSPLSYICHQLPSRSFWLWGTNMGLCSRSFAIYLSMLACTLILSDSQVCSKRFLFGVALILPMLVEVTLVANHLLASNNLIRFTTGGISGIGLSLILLPLWMRISWGKYHDAQSCPAPSVCS